MKSYKWPAVVVMFLSTPAVAYESDGHMYDLRCGKNGYELTSKYPVSRQVGTGADSRQVSGREKIYLGKTCDAYHKLFGKGEWCWANGGFLAKFEDHEFRFGRQELFCDPEPAYSESCYCP